MVKQINYIFNYILIYTLGYIQFLCTNYKNSVSNGHLIQALEYYGSHQKSFSVPAMADIMHK